MSEPAILFVHGAFHGAWCWERVVARLEGQGIVCRCIELHRGGLDADVAAIRAEVDALAAAGHRVVVVGHSLGCASVSSLTPEGIAHAVFLAGPLAGPGLPPARECTMPEFFPSLTFGDDGTMMIDLEVARELFYHDCSPTDADAAIAKLKPNSNYSAVQATDTPFHEAVTSTYIWCDDDRAVRPDYQRQIAKVTRYSEGLASSHSPMLSAPDELVAALQRALGHARE
jgi:pimeloyl-ACP methyl ester carboxylesterase